MDPLKEKNDALIYGSHAEAGVYECVSCGHRSTLDEAGELPTCPNDEGLHAMMEWQRVKDSDNAQSHGAMDPPRPR